MPNVCLFLSPPILLAIIGVKDQAKAGMIPKKI
jgi:hypothetical protein